MKKLLANFVEMVNELSSGGIDFDVKGEIKTLKGALVAVFCKVNVPCPTCNFTLHYTQITPSPQYIHSLLNNLSVTCIHCNANINVNNTPTHACMNTIAKDHNYCRKPQTCLPPAEKERIGTAVLKRKLADSADGKTAVFKTAGKVISLSCMYSF